jgi:ankyrin repeat protein
MGVFDMRKYFRFVIYLIVIFEVSSALSGSYEDFFQAVRLDNAATVGELLRRGFDPNASDETGQPALTLAAREGSAKVWTVLLRQPQLKPDAKNTAGETALMMAAVNLDGWSPLHYAATGPQPEIVRLLLDRGAHVDSRSPNGSTPLMMAAQYGAEESVTVLLARRADARVRNERGLTAADFARLAGRENLALQLEALQR